MPPTAEISSSTHPSAEAFHKRHNLPHGVRVKQLEFVLGAATCALTIQIREDNNNNNNNNRYCSELLGVTSVRQASCCMLRKRLAMLLPRRSGTYSSTVYSFTVDLPETVQSCVKLRYYICFQPILF